MGKPKHLNRKDIEKLHLVQKIKSLQNDRIIEQCNLTGGPRKALCILLELDL